jgi:hypothetical protein
MKITIKFIFRSLVNPTVLSSSETDLHLWHGNLAIGSINHNFMLTRVQNQNGKEHNSRSAQSTEQNKRLY